MAVLTGRALVAAMCLGQVGNLLPHVVVPAIMAQHLMPLWDLSAAQAGLMASAYAFGYMLAVPVLTTLTDRIDARRILIIGSVSSGLATALFGLIADGLWSATLIWGLAGIGFAGAYMPGLKALADRLPDGDASRSITLYTGYRQLLDRRRPLVSRVAACCGRRRLARGVLCCWRGTIYHGRRVSVARPMQTGAFTRTPPRFPAVLRNRAALGYILGYGAHCFELYGMRTWIVAFWTFVLAQSDDSALLGPITVSVIVTLLSLPASVLGNEAALRFGRHRAISAVMVSSAAVALAIGLNAGSSPLLLLALVLIYGVTIPADSGALTSGTTASATPAYRGATLALHSTVGFGLSALGGWGAGVALDAAGGPGRPEGWSALFALLASGVLLGPIALRWSQRDR